MNCFCRQKVTRTIDTGAGFFLEEEDQDESKSKTTEVKHPLGEVKVIKDSRSQLFWLTSIFILSYTDTFTH